MPRNAVGKDPALCATLVHREELATLAWITGNLTDPKHPAGAYAKTPTRGPLWRRPNNAPALGRPKPCFA
eukprot:399471-Lingulodinium_polyedra.AAC.1